MKSTTLWSIIFDACHPLTCQPLLRRPWALARAWLLRCLSQHKKYRRLGWFTQRLPSRLFHLEFNAGRWVVKLRERQDIPEHMPYFTLSHFWGNVRPLQLTEKNVDTLVQGINLEELPPVFCDALCFAGETGCWYTWIDSLCIIQDSPEDKRREVANMGAVYENSLLCIAALGSANCKESLFFA